MGGRFFGGFGMNGPFIGAAGALGALAPATAAVVKMFDLLADAGNRYNETYRFRVDAQNRTLDANRGLSAAAGRLGTPLTSLKNDFKEGLTEVLNWIYKQNKGETALREAQYAEQAQLSHARTMAFYGVRGPMLQQVAGEMGMGFEGKVLGSYFESVARRDQIAQMLQSGQIDQGRADSLNLTNDAAYRLGVLGALRDSYTGVSGLTPASIVAQSIGTAPISIGSGDNIDSLVERIVAKMDNMVDAINRVAPGSNLGTTPR